MSLTCLSSMGDLTGSDEMVCLTDTGDETRAWGPPFVSSESVYFLSVNRNKKVSRTTHTCLTPHTGCTHRHTWGPFQKEGFKTQSLNLNTELPKSAMSDSEYMKA